MAGRKRGWAVLSLAGMLACAGTVTPRSANPYIADSETADQRTSATVGAGAGAVGVAVGVGASAARRAAGECYTPCVPGTECNRQTGLCDPLPCRGQCKPHERCDTSGVFPRCVDDGARMYITPGGPDAGGP